MSDPNAAEWLGAWSTLGGAVGTVGALLVGSITLRRQINDQHRHQASGVTVKISAVPLIAGIQQHMEVEFRNDSGLPVYRVILKATGYGNAIKLQEMRTVVPAVHDKFSFQFKADAEYGAHADFTDAAGVRWRRYSNGDLEEIGGPIPWRRRPVTFVKSLGFRKGSR